jgi:hypothetical protein
MNDCARFAAVYRGRPCGERYTLATSSASRPPAGSTCRDKCEGDLQIAAWQDPSFPFVEVEVNCFITDYFQLQDPTANIHLEEEYLRRHYAETGGGLAAAHRSFQKAAARRIMVIKRRRKGGT